MAEGTKCVIDIPGPCHRTDHQWCQKGRHDVALPQSENSNHKNLKDDDAPYEACEGDWPSLTL